MTSKDPSGTSVRRSCWVKGVESRVIRPYMVIIGEEILLGEGGLGEESVAPEAE